VGPRRLFVKKFLGFDGLSVLPIAWRVNVGARISLRHKRQCPTGHLHSAAMLPEDSRSCYNVETGSWHHGGKHSR